MKQKAGNTGLKMKESKMVRTSACLGESSMKFLSILSSDPASKIPPNLKLSPCAVWP